LAVLKDVIRPGTRRGLDFVVLDELRKRTGIMRVILKLLLKPVLLTPGRLGVLLRGL
jgi:hypothetical protein